MKKIKKKDYLKIGILGGTFDPPHKGHLYISKIALKKLRLNKILLNFSGYVGFSTGLRVLFAPYANVGGAGDSAIAIPGGLSGFIVVAANDTATYQCQSANINYLHSPATTSEIVYTMYWNNPGANTVYLGENYSSGDTCPTFFTATEVLA